MIFSGSYDATDVEFLLKPMQMQDTNIEDKEYLIQSGKKHYSQLITLENPPEPAYQKIFNDALALHLNTIAQHCITLSNKLMHDHPNGITLVSLARAGTPFGVILKRLLAKNYPIPIKHYCVSIIRDCGIDHNALKYIIDQHADTSIAFIDGWTGKGVISNELKKSISEFNQKHQTQISSNLYVLNDPGYHAYAAASNADELVPSCLLNATISGLISRTILNEQIEAHDFHGCVYYQQLKEHDLSKHFVDQIYRASCAITLNTLNTKNIAANQANFHQTKEKQQQWLAQMIEKYHLTSANYIKPGIGETTRTLLRRQPRIIILQNEDATHPHLQHILYLAQQKQIPIEIDVNSPYLASAIITKKAIVT